MDEMKDSHERFMRMAIDLARKGVESNAGGPFGAVVVKNGSVIGEGWNRVTSTNDPTAHAEVMAIRAACSVLSDFQLADCVIYSSCEPCPMCLGAIYWARPRLLLFAANRDDAAAIGFDDQFLYDELVVPVDSRKIETRTLLRSEAQNVFRLWDEKSDKISY